MSITNSKTIVDFIYNEAIPLNGKQFEHLKKESADLLLTPLKVMALLIAISGLFAMVFEVRYFAQYSVEIYVTRLIATLIAFIVLVLLFTDFGKNKPLFLVHVLLSVIILSSGYMIYLMPNTLVVNSQIVGLMIFTSALFLSWDVKNQIIIAIYYNIVFASAILLNDHSIYFLPNMYESVLFVIFLSVISVVGSAVNYQLRMKLADKSYRVELSERKFKSIFNNSMEGMFQSSLEGRFLTVNQALVDIFGYISEDELMEIDIRSNLYNDPADRDSLIAELKKETEIKHRRIALLRKDGRKIIVRLNIRLVTDENEVRSYLEGNLQDITERVYSEEKRKKAEEALRLEKEKSDKLAKEATESSIIKSQFLANMSHEIRTPMNGVIGLLSLIETGAYENEEEMKQFVLNAKQSAEILLDIINEILDLSKIESGKMELSDDELNLDDIIDEAVSVLSAKINEKELEISKNIGDNTSLMLIGDTTRLRQIFVNLIGNAVKFTSKGKIEIKLSSEKLDDDFVNLKVSVRDSGIGIPADKINTLFKPFSQVDGSNTRKFGGTGLGLVICKEFINMMGGEISVKSTEGIGSEFNFNVKLKEQKIKDRLSSTSSMKRIYNINDDAKKTNEMITKNIKHFRNNYKILLAEDNFINQKVALRMLKDSGYNVDAVMNGLEAVEALKNKHYDLVLMDVQMPEMDGFTATQHIRKLGGKYLELPIIAITAHALMGDKERCLDAGMNDYLSKPIERQKVTKIIDQWLKIEQNVTPVKSDQIRSKDLIFDFSHLEKMSLGDKDFQKDLISGYISDMEERYENLVKLIHDNNIEKSIDEAHTIKGASYTVGAKKVGDEALGIELSGKQNDIPSAISRLTDLKNAIAQTKKFLSGIIG